MTLTPADLKGRKTVDAVHMDMVGGKSAWMYGVEGIPRLHVCDYNSRKTGRYRHWYVDKRKVRDLDAALAVLNGTMSLDDATREETIMKKVSLSQQIDEVAREILIRAEVYPRQVAQGKLRQSIADYQVERLKAALVTLQWLRDNETDIRAYVAAKATARAVDEQNCPGHVASERDPKICGHCGTHIDSLRPPETQGDAA